jgi:type I restriction enzyme S subunit
MNFTPEEYETYQLRYGDILLNEGQSLEWVGRPAMYRDDLPGACFQNTLVRFRPHEFVNSRFALLVFRHYLHSRRFQRVAKWTVNIAHLGAQRFAEIEFPLPPLREQEKIADKAEELLSDLEAGVAALKRVKAALSRYRTAVLRAAVEGRLTQERRRETKTAEPAQKLLAQALKKHHDNWLNVSLRRFAEAGKNPPKNWKARYGPPAPPKVEQMSSLPEGWCWATVEQLGTVGEQPVMTGPFGSTLGREDFIDSGIPLLTIGCLAETGVKLDHACFISPQKAQELVRYQLKQGDLLFSRSASVGRVGFVTAELEGSLINYHLMRLRLAHPVISPRYFVYYVRGSSAVVSYLRRVNHGATRDGINTTDLLGMPVALPPRKEQEQIVSEVERRLSVVDVVETEVEQGLKRATRLRQAILRHAFEGRLVPQEAVVCHTGGSAKAELPKGARQEPKGINFRRGAVVSYIVNRLGRNPTFGRTQLEKLLHLTQTHLGLDLSLEFKRHAAGPFDEVIYKVESLGRKQGWFTTEKRDLFGVAYRPGPNIQERCQAALAILGEQRNELDRLLGFFDQMNTEQAELFDTVYAAWNDLLIDGVGDPSAEKITEEVHRWHESKRRFTPGRIKTCVSWMRDHSVVPNGTGVRTRPLDGRKKRTNA